MYLLWNEKLGHTPGQIGDIFRSPRVPPMPRKAHPRHAYLELHEGYYRVTMGVPVKLRPLIRSTRLKRALGTKSLIAANELKKPVVAEFKARIRNAWEAIGGQPRSELEEAVEWARMLSDALESNDRHVDLIQAEIVRRTEEIREEHAQERWVEIETEEGLESFEDPILHQNSVARAENFKSIALGKAVPILLHHDEFLKALKIKPRSLMDDRRAMQIFLKWCLERGVHPYLENITRRNAVKFKNEIMSYTGLGWATCTKYLGRIKKYWDFLLEADLVRDNVWPKKGLDREHEFVEDKERSFSDNEVVILLTGTTDVKMLDVMLVAALTGARVDAVIDLKVGDCSHNCFRFKGQKRELGRRYVPIHPALNELVARRTTGREPNQELFPEWPRPVAAGSVRERSSYFSKRFTAYRRSLGVTDERDAKRRSLLNFHSFRRWFITKGERAGISGDLLAAIVGHKRSGLTLGHYSEGPEIGQARRAICKINLPPLDGRKVIEAQALLPRIAPVS